MTAELEFSSPLAPRLPLRRFTVAQYHQLGEVGVLSPDDRVELLEGWIVEKMNQRPVHGYLVGLLSEWFQSQLPAGYIVRCQLPITTQRSEPEPDVAIVVGAHQDYRQQHPSGENCRLLIEVADTSIERDRAKAAIYHSAGVVEYWILNVSEKCVERYCFVNSSAVDKPSILTAEDRVTIHLADTTLVLDFGPLFD